MVKLIKPTEVKVVTKDGECEIKITLDLNVNLDTEALGKMRLIGKIEEEKEPEPEPEKLFQIPEFKSQKVKFGERV